jgi:hypothetical protein
MNALNAYEGFNMVMMDNILDYLIPRTNQVAAAANANTCQAGVCVAGVTTYCLPSDEFHRGSACEPSTGKCAPGDQAIGGTPCGSGGTCRNGTCPGN